MNRRSLLLGIGSALAAPAIVRAESLMKIAVLRQPTFTDALIPPYIVWMPPKSAMAELNAANLELAMLKVFREYPQQSVSRFIDLAERRVA